MANPLICSDAISVAENNTYIIDGRGDPPGLFRVDNQSGESEFIARIDRRDESGARLIYYASFLYHEKIFFLPRLQQNVHFIIVYDQNTKKVDYLDFVHSDFSPNEGYISLKQIGNELWLFPQDVRKKVAIFSLETYEIRTVQEPVQMAWKIQEQIGRTVKFGDSLVVGETIFTPLADTEYVISYSLKNKECSLLSLDNNTKLSYPIEYIECDFWLVKARNGGVICWNPEQGIKKIISFEEYENPQLKDYHGWFQKILYYNHSLWCIPKNDNIILKVSIGSGQLSRIPISPINDKKDIYGRQYWINDVAGVLTLYPQRKTWRTTIDLNAEKIIPQYEELKYPEGWTSGMDLFYTGAWKRRSIINQDELLWYIRSLTMKECI